MFDSVSTRDFVFSHAKNLGKIPKVDRANFGLRLDYPAHLGSDYRMLDSYGARLRSKFGEGFKRNLRFDDDEMRLFMDICLPRQEEWIRVSAKMARDDKAPTAVKDEEEARKKIAAGLENLPVLTGANSEPMDMERNQSMRDIWNNKEDATQK